MYNTYVKLLSIFQTDSIYALISKIYWNLIVFYFVPKIRSPASPSPGSIYA